MGNPISDIVIYLASLLPSEDVRGGWVPETPDRVIAIMIPPNTIGQDPIDTMNPTPGVGPRLERVILQARCRDVQDDFQAAYNLAYSVFNALHNRLNVTLSGTRYLAIEASESPLTLSIDENHRITCGFHFMATKESNA